MRLTESIVAALAASAAFVLILLAATDEDNPTSPSIAPTLLTTEAAPIEYVGPAAARVLFLSPAQVEHVCKEAGVPKPAYGKYIAACAAGDVIVMPDPCLYPAEGYAKLMCHEKAHILGWRH